MFVMALGTLIVVYAPTVGLMTVLFGVAIVSFDVANVTCNTPCPDEVESDDE
jgi:hypothetical protein